jgi:hypothetical protein
MMGVEIASSNYWKMKHLEALDLTFFFFLYEIKSQTNTLLLQMVKLKIKSPTIYNVKV